MISSSLFRSLAVPSCRCRRRCRCSINGVPSCANSWLLDTVARKSWSFDGYITSDCDAVANVVSPHRYVKTAEEAVAATLKAGMDIDCSYFVGQHGAKALQLGLINESLIERGYVTWFDLTNMKGITSSLPASVVFLLVTAADRPCVHRW